MPLLSEPDSIVSTRLSFDAGKPDDQRIVWQARVLSSKAQAAYDAELDAADKLHNEEREHAIDALILRAAVGWDAVDDDGVTALPLNADSLKRLNRQVKYAIAAQLPNAAGWEAAYPSKKLIAPSPPSAASDAASK